MCLSENTAWTRFVRRTSSSFLRRQPVTVDLVSCPLSSCVCIDKSERVDHKGEQPNAHVHFEDVALFLLELFDVRLRLFDGLAGAGERLDERLVDVRNGPSCGEGIGQRKRQNSQRTS